MGSGATSNTKRTAISSGEGGGKDFSCSGKRFPQKKKGSRRGSFSEVIGSRTPQTTRNYGGVDFKKEGKGRNFFTWGGGNKNNVD